MEEADKAFDAVFHDKIVPEVVYQLKNVSSLDDFAKSVEQMDACKDIVAAGADTPEKQAILATIKEYDEKYDVVFYQKIVPEVGRILEGRIAKYDGESDQYAVVIEEMATNISESLGEEAVEASAEFDSVRPRKQHQLGKSDHVFHHVAGASNQRARTKVAARATAEKMIPLSDNECDDLREFNS